MSPIRDHRVMAIDALSQDWQGKSMYMFPPFSCSGSHLETKDHPGGRSNTNSPLVAVTIVVSTSTTSVCGPPSILSVPLGPTLTTEICLRQQVIPSARMEALMQHYQEAGFSKEVSRLAAAPRKPSTNRIYDDRWLRFAHWADDKELTCLVPQLLE